MQDNILLILTISLLIWSSPFISKMVRIPTPPVEIILGSLFAAFGLIGDNEYFTLIAKVGFLYLMFLAGMEVNLKQLINSSAKVIRQSLLFLFLMVVFISIVGYLFNLDKIIVISMPLISLGILASLSKNYGKGHTWIQLAFIVGVLGEIASIAVLTVFDAASKTGFNMTLLIHLGYLLLFMAAIFFLYRLLHLLFWWYPELKSILMPKLDTSDQDIRLAMALFFILIAVMLTMELELALGAFIAGVAISAFFHHEKKLEEKMSSLGFGFLVPLFFINVGASFDAASLFMPGVVSGALLITFVMIGARVLASVALKPLSGGKNALLIGLSLSMPLTLLIAVATIGHESGLLATLQYYQMVLASIFEILISMIAIKAITKYQKKT